MNIGESRRRSTVRELPMPLYSSIDLGKRSVLFPRATDTDAPLSPTDRSQHLLLLLLSPLDAPRTRSTSIAQPTHVADPTFDSYLNASRTQDPMKKKYKKKERAYTSMSRLHPIPMTAFAQQQQQQPAALMVSCEQVMELKCTWPSM